VFIRSERLFMRPAWDEDWAELHALAGDEALAHGWIAMPQAPRYPHFLVTLPDRASCEDGGTRVIGAVGLTECERSAALHVWIAPDHAGHGYGTEAGRAVLSLARALRHRHIVASQIPDSAPSARVLAKLGFAPCPQARGRISTTQGGATMAITHALRLCPPASDPADPLDCGDMRRAA
jgi:RimJ/RimL family protein N-acetyltransferase